uniref:C2H2-type domain-containing protein n=1 Tax=Salarias fasciatus TaxID=181472 RepID=A0A672HR11_SALFA
MSPAEDLRDFIRQRLAAAAEEICSELQQRVAQYEQQLERQRRLLEGRGGAATPGSSSGLEVKEEPGAPAGPGGPGPPHIKEEPEEECGSPPVKLEPDTFMVTVTDGESDLSDPEADGRRPRPHGSVRSFVSGRLAAAAAEILAAVQQSVEGGRRWDGGWRPAGTGSPAPRFYNGMPLGSGPDQDQDQDQDLYQDQDQITEEACSSQEPLRFVFRTDDLLVTPSNQLRRSDQVDRRLISAAAAAGGGYGDSPATPGGGGRPFFALTSTNPGQSCARCDVCGAAFRLASQLEKHRAVHAGEKPQSCHTCGKMFAHVRSLRNHIRNHTGEKPYTCGECGKKFSQKGHLKSHMNIHTGEKPFFCQTCGKRFCQKSNLISHSRIHTGEKPYSCEICGRSFTGRGNLLVHLRTHTGEKPYPCAVCGKCFSRQDALSAHTKTHTGHKLHALKPETAQSAGV